MKLILVLCALVALTVASYGVNNGGYNQVAYGNQYALESPFYKEPHYKRRHGRHGRHGKRRHHRDSSDSDSDSSSGSHSRSSESHSYEYDGYYPHPMPMPYPVPSYGNIANEPPAANTYGSPSNDVPAPAPYGANTFGRK